MKKQLQNLTKNNLSEFNIAEARGWTIDCLLEIEYRVNDIIILEYFKPFKKTEFEKIVLHSSILDFGSKLKILKNVGIDNKIIEKIRKISSIRNGFAHAPMGENITVTINEEDDDKSSIIAETTIEIMTSNGDIQTKIAYDYLVTFLSLYNEIRENLK